MFKVSSYLYFNFNSIDEFEIMVNHVGINHGWISGDLNFRNLLGILFVWKLAILMSSKIYVRDLIFNWLLYIVYDLI